jgi:hypothetical protein
MKTKCPKDADIMYDGQQCNAINKEKKYMCSRKKGHKGKHHAHGAVAGSCYAVWSDKDEL